MTSGNVREVRQALIDALPADTSTFGKSPERRHVHVPFSHVKALRLESSLVVGTRGAGKTFWSAALTDPEIRASLGSAVPDLSRVEVVVGFGERPRSDDYPNSDTFSQLFEEGFNAYEIWRGVVARQIVKRVGVAVSSSTWLDTVSWTRKNPESFARAMEQLDADLEKNDDRLMLVFDALDRTSDSWPRMNEIVRDLLRVALSIKPFARLSCKIFLREDQFSNRDVTAFPDASKLVSTKVELSWSTQDLHGLLWQYLCNGADRAGEVMRKVFREAGDMPPRERNGVWWLPDRAKREVVPQRCLFEELAGKWMGRDHRRGIPYTWSVGHLADGQGRTSPRSFLAAIRAAAEHTADRYSDHPTPLHFEGIKRGVQEASSIRVNELAEDYPWVNTLMKPLEGLTVPCYPDEFVQRWTDSFGPRPNSALFRDRLPPEHIDDGWSGIAKDLEDLGIMERMKDGRRNMPDLYRVGYRLGRKGGVKPAGSRSAL